MIIKCKGKKEEVTEVNEASIAVKARNTLLNYVEAISQFLLQIHKFFPNRCLNRKCLFSKMRTTNSIIVEYIILSLREALKDQKFCMKKQPLQY